MSAINIRRDVSDKFYRYKMPKLIAKVEGRGNGIKTVVSNMDLIAKSLARPATYPTKCTHAFILVFGCELGAQVTCDEKTNRYVLTGAHDQEKLQNTLDGFIDKFVLCSFCKNPETDLVVTKEGYIDKNCKACGAKTPVDMRHKLVTFILKNQEPSKIKKEKRAAKHAEVDALTRQIQTDAANLVIDKENDNEFQEDTSEDAVAQRQKDLAVSDAVAKLLLDDEPDEVDPLELFAAYVTEQSAQLLDSQIHEKAMIR